MGAATRERTGRSGRRASGPSRRQRSNEPAATAPATTSSAPAATTLRATARTGRVRPLRAAAGDHRGGARGGRGGCGARRCWLVPAGVLVVLLVLLAVVRRRGRSLPGMAVRRPRCSGPARGRRAPVPPSDGAGAGAGRGVRPGSAALTSTSTGTTARSGMVGDGTFLTAVVRVEADATALRPDARRPAAARCRCVRDVLEVDGIRLESAQLVQHTQPAPAPHLPQQSVARLATTRRCRHRPGRPRCGSPGSR